MDKSFSEQRIRIVDTNYIVCEKNWTRTHSRTGSYGRWQVAGDRWQVAGGRWQVAGGRRNTDELGNF